MKNSPYEKFSWVNLVNILSEVSKFQSEKTPERMEFVGHVKCTVALFVMESVRERFWADLCSPVFL